MPGVPVRFPNASLLREWDARGYDRVAETMSAWSRAAGAGRALLLERAGITPGQRVLDLCSGPGWLAIEAARAVAPDGHVTGLDLSAGMVATARANAAAAGVGNVEFHQGDAEELPFGDASFDGSVCSLGLMHVPDPGRALAELARVIVPGGRLVANVHGPEGETTLDLMAAAFDDAGEFLPLDYRYLVRLGNAELLESLAHEAGFAETVVLGGAGAVGGAGRVRRLLSGRADRRRRRWGGARRHEAEAMQVVRASAPLPDAGAFWDGFREVGGLFSGLIEELSPAAAGRARASFVERCAPYRTEQGYALPDSQFVLVAAR